MVCLWTKYEQFSSGRILNAVFHICVLTLYVINKYNEICILIFLSKSSLTVPPPTYLTSGTNPVMPSNGEKL